MLAARTNERVTSNLELVDARDVLTAGEGQVLEKG